MRLQSVLRAAARLVLQLPARASVAAAMRDTLHWLSFPHRVTYKLCLLTYKCLHGLAPDYLSSLCVPLSTVTGRISALLTVSSSWCPGRVQSRSDHVLSARLALCRGTLFLSASEILA